MKSSGIPPFANSAKDGAPDPLWLGKRMFSTERSVVEGPAVRTLAQTLKPVQNSYSRAAGVPTFEPVLHSAKGLIVVT